MTKKQFFRALCFFLIVVLLLFSTMQILRSKDISLGGFYAEPENSIDVVIIGGSHVHEGYIPAVLWRDYNISAYNIFSWNLPIWGSYHYLIETLKTQDIKVAVIELYAMLYGNSYITPEHADEDNYKTGMNIKTSLNQYGYMYSSYRASVEDRPFADYLNIPRYHYRWQELSADDFKLFSQHTEPDYFKGYGMMIGVSPQPDYRGFKALDPIEPYRHAVEYLEKIVSLAQREGVELIFTLSPYFFNETERGIYLWLEQYAAEKGIPFLNYNDQDGIRIGLDFSQDLVDIGHTNYFGALKVTHDVGSFIAGNYELPNRKNTLVGEQLDLDSALFGRVETANLRLLETDSAAFLADVFSDPHSEILFAVADLGALSEPLLPYVEGSVDTSNTFGSVGGSLAPSPLGVAQQTLFDFEGFDFELSLDGGSLSISLFDNPLVVGADYCFIIYDTLLETPYSCFWLDPADPSLVVQREILSAEKEPPAA